MFLLRFKSKITDTIDKNRLFNDIINLTLKGTNNFTCITKKSTANSSGNGVFISGGVKKHQIVSLYPGTFEPPPPPLAVVAPDGDHCISPDELSLRNTSEYRIHCNSCGGYIDAAKAVKGVDTKFGSIVAQFVVGHMINHPPKGVKPNVFPVDFYWHEFLDYAKKSVTPDQMQQLQHLADNLNSINCSDGNVWYVDPVTLEPVPLTAKCSPMVGIAILARDNIESSSNATELWMDYKFNPKSKLPSWYAPVDY